MGKSTNNSKKILIQAKQDDNLSEAVAEQIFAVVPSLMQTIRQEMRGAVQGLTIPQFRILGRLENNGATNHCDLADWIGVSLPAISRMINMLEKRGLVSRDRQRKDRRYVHLTLTIRGSAFFRSCRSKGKKSLAKRFSSLSSSDKGVLLSALNALGSALINPGEINEKANTRSNGRVSLGLRAPTKQHRTRSTANSSRIS